MAYQLTALNKRNVPGGAECSVVITDDASTYPTVRQEMQFAGKTAAQLTAGFLAPYVKAIAARVIQQAILLQANTGLDALVANRWQIDVVPAIATFDANVRARLASLNIDEATIATKIMNQWAAYNVNGAMPNPVVTIVLNEPVGPDDEVTAVNG